MTIERDQMMEPILDVLPSFRPSWEEFLAEWEEEELPLYIVLADLTRHLDALVERGDYSSFDEVFEVVERWHKEADEYVQTAATIGFLESLQITRHAEQLRSFSRPESEHWWKELNLFWEKPLRLRRKKMYSCITGACNPSPASRAADESPIRDTDTAKQ